MARVQEIHQRLNESIYRDINSWLQPIHQTPKFDANIQARGESTCQWILRDPTFIQWLEAKRGLFWYHGLMGTGKTVTASFIIQTLLARDDIHVAYYYFEFTNSKTLSEEALHRSVVAQLVPAAPSIMRDLHQKHYHGSREPQLSTLQATLIDLVSMSSKPVYIILDALDELPPAQRKYLLRSLLTFCCSTGAALTHVMVTSREDRDIRDAFEDQADFHLGVQGDLVRQDIAAFVDQQLAMKKWSRWPEEHVQLTRRTLNERADGQFRLVASSQLHECLHSLPTTLISTYEYTINRIPHDLRDAARKLFACLAFAYDKITLTELCALIAVDIGDRSDLDQLPTFQEANHFWDPLDLLNLGTSFVSEIEYHEKQVLQLSHASVKEYFLMDSGSWFALRERPMHDLIASACLAVLLHFEVLIKEAGPTPFSYSQEMWYAHILPHCPPALLTQQRMLYMSFPWTTKSRPNHSGYKQKYLLSSAASFCLLDFLESSLVSHVWEADTLGCALFAAASSYYSQTHAIQCCSLLVRHGARVDYCGLEGTALHAASLAGKLDVVQFLVEEGADVNAEGGEYGTALQAASSKSSNGCLDILHFLLQNGANVNAVGGLYGTALQAAMVRGSLDHVKLLTQAGAIVNFMKGIEESTYYAFAWSESLEVIQFLVYSGIDVNGRGEYGTPLQAAARWGRLDIVQFLVQNGADVNAAEGEDGTALSTAAKEGSLEVVEFLVQAGAEVNAVGVDWPALQAAARSACLKTVQFLVREGADVNARGGLFGNALQAAAESGSLEVAQFLVQNGAEVDARGGLNWTPLRAAAGGWAGGLELVRFLVQEGADVNARGGQLGTALQAAAYGGRLKIIQFLLHAGADVNTVGGLYGTALQAATVFDRGEIMEVLLQMGADANVERGSHTIEGDAVTIRCLKNSYKRRYIVSRLRCG
ncbi:ankyrin repeat-containing domain protein [Flagelloscypha sp. PMI_526]|nr:ankyrin repeat-containing domain protein [Flagelloscypha sp. PMI_526]